MSSKKNLTPSERIQANQREKLRGFMKGILNLFGKYINSPFQIPNLLQQLTQTKEFNSFTERLGLRFVNEVKVWNERTFKEYMKTSYAEKSRNIFLGVSRDDEFQKFIQKQAEERANLFKRIPVNLANHVTTNISKWSVQGMTSKEVSYKLREYIPNLLESQVKTIARTETSKTLIGLTSYKSLKNNIPCYQWKASGGYSGDGRTRNSHRHMSDVIVFWNDPPAPEDLFPTGYRNTLGHYHAGCCQNCRCSAMPVVFVEDLKFPVRVYRNGQITKMNKMDFLKLYNGKINELKAENAQKKLLNQKPKQEIQSIEKQIIKKTVEHSKTIPTPQTFPSGDELRKNTISYLNDNFKIKAELEDFNDETVRGIKDSFTKINNEIIKETGKNIQITTIKIIKSSEKIYNQIIQDKYIDKKLTKEIKDYNTQEQKAPSDKWKKDKREEIEKKIKEDMGLQESDEKEQVLAFYAPKNCEEFIITYGKEMEDLSGLYLSKKNIRERNTLEYKNSSNNTSDKNWSPPNCDNVNGTINHEIGHAIDDFLDLSNNASYNGIKELYEKDFKKKLNFLSEYSFYKEKKYPKFYEKHPNIPERFKEFVAEAISEYLTVEKPRETALNVWEIVINEFKNKS